MKNFFTDKPLLRVVTESGMIHESFEVEDKIVACENIGENYPPSSLHSFNNIDDYISSIRDISWINDEDYIRNISDKLSEKGFPFEEDNEFK